MIPKFNETMLPILNILSDGKDYTLVDIVERLYKEFNVTKKERKLKSQNGSWIFYNKVWWGKSYLKQAWLIEYPNRGYTKITKEWLKVLEEWLNEISVNYLKRYESFLNFITPNKKEINKSNCNLEDLSPTDLIEQWYKNFYNSLKNDLLDKLKNTNPYYFEKVILILFKKMWYWEYKETFKSWDWWIDGIINQDQLGIDRIYTQAKRYNNWKVREKDIRNFIWAMSWDVSKWIFVTTTDFDKKAIEKANDAIHKIILINWNKLTELMIKFNVWVQVKDVFKIKYLDLDFFIED